MPSFGEQATQRSLEPQDILCREGESTTDVFQIFSGSLQIERLTEVGPMVVETLGPGHIVGEVTSALGGTRTATVRATEPTIVRTFTQSDFSQWLEAHPDTAAEIADQARLRSNRSRASAVLANLFELESREVVDAIVNEISWITLAPGDAVFRQGDRADAAYLLLAGRLHVTSEDADGQTSLNIEIGRGEIVGEMGILEDAPRSATVRAIRETTLAMISRDAFEKMTALYPGLMVKVFLMIIDRLLHRRSPDRRARVVTIASTMPTADSYDLTPLVSAVRAFGSGIHLSSKNLHEFVRDVDGPGGSSRVASFLHEADVAHEYVLLETDVDLSDWSVRAARQSDRFLLLCSANPDADERASMSAFLDLLSDAQRAAAWVVRVHSSATRRPSASARFIDDFGVAEVHNIRAEEDAHLERIGRLATGNGRGVVLGGGGAKGFSHVGALRALREAGLDYDRIGGASMGAVIGGFAATDDSWQDVLEATTREFHKNLLDYTVPLVSLMKAERIAEGLERHFGEWGDVTDLWIPYFCVTTNITRAELAVHRRGDLARVIRASVAIPVAFPPVPIQGDLHVDGGVLDNVPVTAMSDDPSIGMIVAVDCSPAGGPAAEEDYGLHVSGVDVLKRRFLRKESSPFPDIGTTLMSSMLIGSSKARNDSVSDGVVDLYIDLDLEGVGLLKFENHAEVAERGYQGAKAAIDEYLDSAHRSHEPAHHDHREQ